MVLHSYGFHNFDANIHPFTHTCSLQETAPNAGRVLTPSINTADSNNHTNTNNHANFSGPGSSSHNVGSSGQERPPRPGAKFPLSDPELQFLQHLDPDVDRLIRALEAVSTLSNLKRSKRDVNEYAASRGLETAVGMRASNRHDIEVGQVWRPIAATVKEDILKIDKSSSSGSSQKNSPLRRPFGMKPAWLKPQCDLIWRDAYDCAAVCIDEVSVATTIELAAAGRTAYNWLSRRHRAIISSDCIGYIGAVIKAVASRERTQYKNCEIDPVPLCRNMDIRVKRESILIAHTWLALLLRKQDAMYEYQGEHDHANEDAVILLDHASQIAMLHVRGTWGGDVPILEVHRRRSELLNFIPHGIVTVAFGEIRTCSCCVEEILSAFADTVVTEADVRACDKVVRYPGLVPFQPGILILTIYGILFVGALFATVTSVITVSTEKSESSESSRLDVLNAALGAVAWSIAIITSLHVIVTQNMLPGIELRQMAKRLRFSTSLDDMRLSHGAMICLAQDPRTNSVLAPANASAYAHRPIGSVNVTTLPNAREAWSLGLVVTDSFAIKLEQRTPLIRGVVKNLDGSVFVDWDSTVQGFVVGKLVDYSVLIG